MLCEVTIMLVDHSDHSANVVVFIESLSDGQHWSTLQGQNAFKYMIFPFEILSEQNNVQDVLAGVRGVPAAHRAARGPDQGAPHPRAGQRLPPQLLQGE